MANVLIVDDSNSSELPAFLREGGSQVASTGAKGAVASARASQPDLVVVSSLGDASARFVAHLIQHLAASCPPVLVVLPQRNDTLRDQCLIAGARDVSFEGGLEEVAQKVDTLSHGWLRGTPKRPFVGLVRAQRGKQSLTLQASDIDPSGLGLASVDELALGELVRVALALPGGSLVVWGRVTEADGKPGLRFVGLAADDRVKLANAIKGAGERTPSSKTLPPVAPPVMVPSATPSPAPAAVVPLEPEPLSIPDEEPPTEAVDDVSAENSTTATATSAESDIGSLIGSALDENHDASADGSSGVPEGDGAADPDVVLRPSPTAPWPSRQYVADACFGVLRDALTLGLVGEVEGAPLGPVVLEFTRSLSLPEQRAFDPEPPASLPEQGLTIRCLELRMRLFAVARDALADAATGAGSFAIDPALVVALDAEVNAASDELQNAINVFIATSDTSRIKEMNQFRNTLLKAHADYRSALAVLRGEATEQSGRAVLLDVAEQTLDQRRGSSTLPPVQSQAEKKPVEVKASDFKKASKAQTKRQKQIGLLVLLVALLGGAIWMIPQGASRLGPEELAQIGALDIIVAPDAHKATVTIPDTWAVTRPQVEKVKALLAKYDINTFVVKRVDQMVVAYVAPNREPTLLPPSRRVAEKK